MGERARSDRTIAEATDFGSCERRLRFPGLVLSPLTHEGDGDLLGGK